LHFIGQDDTPFLVDDIFALGEPIAIQEEGEGGSNDRGIRRDVTLGSEAPKQFDTDLASIYPNPFNPATTVRFTLAGASDVTIAVYDVRGALVRVLIDGNMPGGEHTIKWNGTDAHGQPVSSGVYFARMISGAFDKSRKMVMLK
jgi:hypothetical protein